MPCETYWKYIIHAPMEIPAGDLKQSHEGNFPLKNRKPDSPPIVNANTRKFSTHG